MTESEFLLEIIVTAVDISLLIISVHILGSMCRGDYRKFNAARKGRADRRRMNEHINYTFDN